MGAGDGRALTAHKQLHHMVPDGAVLIKPACTTWDASLLREHHHVGVICTDENLSRQAGLCCCQVAFLTFEQC